MKRQIQKISDLGLNFLGAIGNTEILRNLVFSLSPTIQTFFIDHPNLMGTMFMVAVWLIFWRARSKTVTEKLIAVIDESLDTKLIDDLAKSESFKIVFPQIFEALIKEVSGEKSESYYTYFRHFIQNPNSNSKYITKALFVLMQMTPEELDFLSIFQGELQQEYVTRNNKIGMTLEKANQDVWRANTTQLNFVLNGKYPDAILLSIINSLYSHGIIIGATTYNGAMAMNGITEFGKYFIDSLKNSH